MSLLRLIPRLDIKSPNLIKPVRMEGLRVIGNPHEYALRYAHEADELLYIDAVASLYGRNNLTEILEKTVESIFIPVTVGGGIRRLEDVRNLLNHGADKVTINTGGLRNPRLLADIADKYGRQCLVVSIEAKRTPHGWEAYTDGGRERSGKDAIEWAVEASQWAGELLVTSIDQEGTMKGFDCELIGAISPRVDVPLIACGGMGNCEHLYDVLEAGADAVSMASVLHYNKVTLKEMQNGLAKRQFQTGRGSQTGREETRSQGRV